MKWRWPWTHSQVKLLIHSFICKQELPPAVSGKGLLQTVRGHDPGYWCRTESGSRFRFKSEQGSRAGDCIWWLNGLLILPWVESWDKYGKSAVLCYFVEVGWEGGRVWEAARELSAVRFWICWPEDTSQGEVLTGTCTGVGPTDK